MKITKIVQQKKNKKRFSIYVDDEFCMGISDETLVKYDLKKDDVISSELIDRIRTQEEKFDIRNRMLRLMQHRSRSSYELEQRFRRDGYDRVLINEVIADLIQEGALNNEQMIKAFISDNTKINPHGNRHILYELRKKGIPETKISEMLSGRDEKEICLAYLKRKLSMLRLDDPKDRRKAIRRLISRGFTPSIVYDVVKETGNIENDQ